MATTTDGTRQEPAMHTHPHTLGNLAIEMGRVRQAEATRERHLAQARSSARGGTGGRRIARGPLATALVALAAVLFFASTGDAAPQEPKTAKVDATNYFVQHPGPASGQTDIDPFDPYAPVDISTVLMSVSFTSAEGVGEEWTPPPPLGRPGQPS